MSSKAMSGPSATTVDPALGTALADWAELSNEYVNLQESHDAYQQKFSEYLVLQKKCSSGVNHQRYRLKAIQNMLRHVKPSSPDEEKELQNLEKDMMRRQAQITQLDGNLPKESGKYLKVILGNINVSILDKAAKYDYKDEYERFKLIVNLVALALAIFCLYMSSRLFDLIFIFLTVWYYCTLTIRESILKVNGSRIKGWWRAHHFISTFAAGVMLIWPDGQCYDDYRLQMMCFNIYLAFIQYLQFAYQRGVLYRMRSLGERSTDMDITIDGFHSWMFKGLSFLLPFLYFGYFFELYNSYTLFYLSFREDATWQIPCLGLVFAFLGGGNIITTSWTIPSKIGERHKGLLKLRFTRLDKYFWSHKKKSDELEGPGGNEGDSRRNSNTSTESMSIERKDK